MPTTPAYPPHSAPRLFIDADLSQMEDMLLEGPQAHYLLNVMRIKSNDPVTLFDDKTGEYHAHISSIGKRKLTLTINGKTREREESPDLWLCAAPIKKDRYNWVAEKACELGIAALIPVRTERTNAPPLKSEKLRAHMIEAAEQCERTALPVLEETVSLTELLKNWPKERHLFVASERVWDTSADRKNFAQILSDLDGPAAILIGPEGGFSDAEIKVIQRHEKALAMSLGPRILRAETAAITAISIWMAAQGDWG